VGPFHAAHHSDILEFNLKNQAKKIMPEVVNKLITKATADLEDKRKDILKKMDDLIKAREKEEVGVKEVINVINELKTAKQELQRKLETTLETCAEQDKKMRAKESEAVYLRERLINSLERELAKTVRASEIEMEETDDLTQNYQQIY